MDSYFADEETNGKWNVGGGCTLFSAFSFFSPSFLKTFPQNHLLIMAFPRLARRLERRPEDGGGGMPRTINPRGKSCRCLIDA